MDFKFINTEYLETVSGGDLETIQELINMFRDQVCEVTKEMKVHLMKKDYPALGMITHKIKSSVAIMGMNDLAQMLKDFELQVKEGKNTEQYETYISRFEHETIIAIEELDKYVINR